MLFFIFISCISEKKIIIRSNYSSFSYKKYKSFLNTRTLIITDPISFTLHLTNKKLMQYIKTLRSNRFNVLEGNLLLQLSLVILNEILKGFCFFKFISVVLTAFKKEKGV